MRNCLIRDKAIDQIPTPHYNMLQKAVPYVPPAPVELKKPVPKPAAIKVKAKVPTPTSKSKSKKKSTRR